MRKHLLVVLLTLAIIVSFTAGTLAIYANTQAAAGKQAEAKLPACAVQAASLPMVNAGF